MTEGKRPAVRLLFRVDPVPLESPRGYLCRAAYEHNYIGPLSLVRLAGLLGDDLENADAYARMSHLLRLELDEWQSMCYRRVQDRHRHNRRLFYGERISADDLNYRCPRLCPACLREHPIWWAIWDLGLVTACPIHGCLLLGKCPDCGRRLAWQRLAVHRCRCGLDFRDLAIEPADRDLLATNAAIYRAAGFTCGDAGESAVASCRFPAELLGLPLGPLLRLILFVGSIKEQDRLRSKQQFFTATDLTLATHIGRSAASLLGDWPRPLRAVLRRMLPPETGNPADLNFSRVFGNFYRHLFRVLPRNRFGFLHEAFETFVIEDWKGLVRGQHRYFSAAVRLNARWVAATEAERIAHTTGKRILELAHQGQIEAIFLKMRRGGNRTECWIRRESLDRWIAARDVELARYMPRPEAVEMLGLKNISVSAVAAAGVIRYVKGPDRNFPSGCFFFLREDVVKIKEAFERHRVPMMAYSKPGDLIALQHAMKNYLGRSAGLAAAIQAVAAGTLVPVARTKRFRGITGYIFRAEDLRRCRRVPGTTAPPGGFLNYHETAALLGIRTDTVRGLAEQGFLSRSAGFRNGFARLIAAKEAQQFSARYVATSVLAERLRVNSGSLLRHLKESGTPLLTIPIPAAGRGYAYFLKIDIAAQMQFPSGRILKEEARRRIKAYGRARWEEYRLAREAELGRPLRRLRNLAGNGARHKGRIGSECDLCLGIMEHDR